MNGISRVFHRKVVKSDPVTYTVVGDDRASGTGLDLTLECGHTVFLKDCDTAPDTVTCLPCQLRKDRGY